MTTPQQLKQAKAKSNRIYLVALLLFVAGLVALSFFYRIQYIKGLEG